MQNNTKLMPKLNVTDTLNIYFKIWLIWHY